MASRPRGICQGCGASLALRKPGVIAAHVGDGGLKGYACSGQGQPPDDPHPHPWRMVILDAHDRVAFDIHDGYAWLTEPDGRVIRFDIPPI